MTVSLFSALFVLLTGFFSWRFSKTCFTPWFLIIAAQIGGIGLYYLKLHPFATDLNPITWLAIAAFLIPFFIGNIVAKKFLLRRSNNGNIGNKPLRVHQILPVLILLTAFGTIIGYRYSNGWPMLMENKDGARIAFSNMSWYGSYPFLCITAMGYYGGLMLLAKAPWKKITAILALFLLFWIAFVVGMRGYLIFFIFLFLATWDTKKSPISPTKGIAFLALTLVVFIGLFVIRFDHLAFSELSTKLSTSQKITLLFQPLYVYVSNNFWNFDSALSRLSESQSLIFSPGYWTLGGVFFFTSVPGSLNLAYGFTNQYDLLLKAKNLNTMPIEWNFYADFGWFGILFGGLAFGFFASYFFYTRRKSDFHLSMHSIFSLGCVLSFFTNIFNLPDIALFTLTLFGMIGISSLEARRVHLQ